MRPLEEADAEELYALVDANRAELSRWMPWAAEQDLDGTREFIRAARRRLDGGEGLEAAIVRDGALAGVEHLLTAWQLNRIEIRAAPENTRSRAIPQRLGFREEATLRETDFVGDRFLDGVVYSLLASDRN